MKVSALDESGNPVDWFFIYKVPNLSAGATTDAMTGYEYVYYDATIDKLPINQRIIARSPYLLNTDQGALNRTLDSIFNVNSKTTGYILYNDEKPPGATGGDNSALGHTKGVLAFDTADKTGFWLLHSWPKWADVKAKADPAPNFGQTYLCLSLDLDTLEQIAGQMITHQQPQTYECDVDCLDRTSNLYKLSQTIDPADPGAADVLKDLKTIGGTPFMVIAKNRGWNQDFWNGLVGPTLGEDIDVDTWIRGQNVIPPSADTDGIHKTFDIKYINMGPLGIHVAWPESHDHAKWAITTHTPWVCVGDINRMISQRKRGGGCICFQNLALWTALSKSDLLLAPPGMTRDKARALIHATQNDPLDPDGSSPAPKIHTMAYTLPRKPPTYRGKVVSPAPAAAKAVKPPTKSKAVPAKTKKAPAKPKKAPAKAKKSPSRRKKP